MTRMPALFIGHGNPMNTLESNDFTRAAGDGPAAAAPARRAGRVGALVHWRNRGHRDAASPYDPRLLRIPAGTLRLRLSGARHARAGKGRCGVGEADLGGAGPRPVGSRPWDLERARTPLSGCGCARGAAVNNALKPMDYHLALGAKLANLRDQGVMVVTSGNVVHNLGLVQWDRPDDGFDWARRFDDAVLEQLATDPGGILKLQEHLDYGLAVPTPDHYIPMLYLAGMAMEASGAQSLIRGYAMGSLSMTCYGLGVDATMCVQAEGAAKLPSHVLADQTNM